jgi:hypothetical protein
MFTFGEGTKLHNTHLGTVKLYFSGPCGIKPLIFDNVALVPGAKSNILSEYWLRQVGYRIVESRKGEHKFVLWQHKLVCVAHAVNGAYYIRNKTLQDRQVFCNAVKNARSKALVLPGIEKAESLLKEWHVRLGHLNKESW